MDKYYSPDPNVSLCSCVWHVSWAKQAIDTRCLSKLLQNGQKISPQVTNSAYQINQNERITRTKQLQKQLVEIKTKETFPKPRQITSAQYSTTWQNLRPILRYKMWSHRLS